MKSSRLNVLRQFISANQNVCAIYCDLKYSDFVKPVVNLHFRLFDEILMRGLYKLQDQLTFLFEINDNCLKRSMHI